MADSRIQSLFSSTDDGAANLPINTVDSVHARLLNLFEDFSEDEAQADEASELAVQLEHLQATLEELQEHGGGTPLIHGMINVSLESIAARTGVLIQSVGMESADGKFDYQASLETISNMKDRLLQLHITNFKATVDAFGLLLGGQARKAAQFKNKIAKYRTEWDQKKRSGLERQDVIGSYAGGAMAMAFTVGDKMAMQPVAQTTKDLAYSRKILVDYPKRLQEYAGKVLSILKGAKVTDDQAFYDTVVKKLAALPHPSTLMDPSIVGAGQILLLNWGLQYKVGTPPQALWKKPEFEKLAKLAQKRLIKRETFALGAMKVVLLHDITVKVSEMDKLFDNANAYMDLVANYRKNLEAYGKPFKDIQLAMKNLSNQKASLTKDAKQALDQVGQFLSNLNSAYTSPVKMEITRVMNIGLNLTYFAARMITHAK